MKVLKQAQLEINGHLISGIKTDSPLHAGCPSTAEILVREPGQSVSETVWVGPNRVARDVFLWIGKALEDGADLAEICEYIEDHREVMCMGQ